MKRHPGSGTEPSRPGMMPALTVAGIVLVAASLRAPITSVGPVISEISSDLGLSAPMAGLVTTIPLLAFALLSGFVSGLARKYRMEGVLLASLGLLMTGLLIRPAGNTFFLFTGTAVIGAAITAGNVLMPAFIKLNYPAHLGVMTGVYAACMNLSAALASGFSISLGRATGMGWKGSLGIWTILVALAFAAWLPQVLGKRAKTAASGRKYGRRLWSSRLAWQVTVFMGLQSMLFYCMIAWLPVIVHDWGMPPEEAGWLLSWFQLAQLPVMFGGPVVAGRMKDQASLIWVTCLLLAAGVSGLLFGKTAFIFPSVIVTGVASGLAFSLSMIFFSLRSRDAGEASSLSGMAQAFGYLLAAAGPVLFGVLHDLTGDWTWPIAALLLLSLFMLVFGLGSAKDRYV